MHRTYRSTPTPAQPMAMMQRMQQRMQEHFSHFNMMFENDPFLNMHFTVYPLHR